MKSDGYIDIAKKLGSKAKGNSGFLFSLGDDQLFASLYAGNGLVKRYIDLLSDDMTRQWVTIPEDVDGAVLHYMKKLRAKFEIKNAIKTAKLFGGSIVFMVIDDGLEPNKPVNMENIRSIKKLRFFSRKNIHIKNEHYYSDPLSEKYGEPEYLTIYTEDGLDKVVHESRCLIFKGEYHPSDELGIEPNHEKFWGISILQSLYEIFENYGLSLEALLKVFQKFNIDVLKIKNLMDLLRNPDGQKQLEARAMLFDLAKSVSTTLVLDSEENFDVVSQSLTGGVSEAFGKIQESLSAMAGMPTSILMGTTNKGLNTNKDYEIRLYYDRIKSDQEEEMLTQLEYLTKLISYSKDSNVDEKKEYSILFNSLWQQTEDEKVEMRKKQSEIDEIYITNGVYTNNEVRKSRFGNDNYSIETEVEGNVELKVPNYENKSEVEK